MSSSGPVVHSPDCRARVLRNEPIAQDVREVILGMVSPPRLLFQAGQHVSFPLQTLEGKPGSRAYSVASEPARGEELVLLVRMLKDGTGSRFINGLRGGDEVAFRGPLGRFLLCGERTKPLLFVAHGTGIAPLRSMIRELLIAERSPRPMTLYFGVRGDEDIFYFDEFRRLESRCPNFRFVPTLSRPRETWAGERGRVTQVLPVQIPDARRYDAYLCGSGEMIAQVRKLLLDRGIDPEHVHQEKFY